jgi:Ca-activated chloride channel family protein
MKTHFSSHVARSVAIAAIACGLAANTAAHDILDVALDQPVRLVGGDTRAFLKVTLTGAELYADRRAPANVGIILDRSGSMQGEKLARAKEAAIMAINRLGREDIVSFVVYDDGVQVLKPRRRVTDRQSIRAAIERIQAGGSTALFAGVSKGAAEVRKFLAEDRVNRVILLSDGLANVGAGRSIADRVDHARARRVEAGCGRYSNRTCAR